MLNQLHSPEVQTTAPRSLPDCVLCLALDVAQGLLENGDSVNHVEETIRRICRAYGGEHVETFVISSLILASVRMADGSYSLQIRRVYDSVNNIARLEHFNAFSRHLCAETPDCAAAQQMLKAVKAKRPYPVWIPVAGSALGASSFAMFFGGSFRDALAGAVVGLVLGWLIQRRSAKINALAKTLILSFIAGLLACLSVLVGLGQNVDMVVIGSIMLLVPGLAFGNALRDLLGGDILTGMLKTVQSCLTAVLIACGYSLAFFVLSACPIQSSIPAIAYPFAVRLLTALLGTVAFSAIFRVRPNWLLLATLGGGAVYSVFCLCETLGAPAFAASFFCALFGATYAEICARLCRAPATVFLTPSIISIVPGGSLYYTMSALLAGNTALGLEKAALTLSISAGLVVGTMAVTIITSLLRGRKA